MQPKLIISLVSAAMICVTPVTNTTVAAAEPYSITSPFYTIAHSVWSDLTVSGSSVTCKSEVKSVSAVKIVAVQTLEKQGFLWIWRTYDNTVWTETTTTNGIAMSNTKTGLPSGKYRLRTDFTLTDVNGETETVTVYSTEKAVG